MSRLQKTGSEIDLELQLPIETKAAFRDRCQESWVHHFEKGGQRRVRAAITEREELPGSDFSRADPFLKFFPEIQYSDPGHDGDDQKKDTDKGRKTGHVSRGEVTEHTAEFGKSGQLHKMSGSGGWLVVEGG